MNKCFGKWSQVLVRCDKLILFVFLAIYIAMSTNMRLYETFKYQKRIWTPIVSKNTSLIIVARALGQRVNC